MSRQWCKGPQLGQNVSAKIWLVETAGIWGHFFKDKIQALERHTESFMVIASRAFLSLLVPAPHTKHPFSRHSKHALKWAIISYTLNQLDKMFHLLRVHSLPFPFISLTARIPNLFGTRDWFHGRQFFHGQVWGRMVLEWFKHITFIVQFISIIITLTPPQIIKH